MDTLFGKRWIGSIALTICFLGWVSFGIPYLSAFSRGQHDAAEDISHGRYQELGYGLPASWRNDYTSLLRERYGIKFRAVAGCLISESLESYVAGYNSVASAAAMRKFGHNVFRECAEEARLRSRQFRFQHSES